MENTENTEITLENIQDSNSHTDNVTSNTEVEKKLFNTREEVLQYTSSIVSNGTIPTKEEIEYLKAIFYKLSSTWKENKKEEYISSGGIEEDFLLPLDNIESDFKAQINLIKERRAKIHQEEEKKKEKNLNDKLQIIEEIKVLITSPEDASKAYTTFKELQQKWKDIGNVPADKATEIWRNYNHYSEQFYDLVKLNHEARIYDFKKNLEQKLELCAAAEKLQEMKDVVRAFSLLQDLHLQYKEIGPVERELREEVWTRFKTASAIIYKQHQEHFETLHKQQNENLEKKTLLCESVEKIANNKEYKKISDWDKASKEILAIQAEWKKIGFAPQKVNNKIFERFRSACDIFFTRKSDYFKELKAKYSENISKKKDIISKAKTLSESANWRKNIKEVTQLQEAWKKIGFIPKRISDQLWEEFSLIKKQIFEAHSLENSEQKNEEKENLKKKKEIISKLETFLNEEVTNIADKIYSLTDEYDSIGHVPFRDKNKIYDLLQDTLERIYSKYGLNANSRELEKYKEHINKLLINDKETIKIERRRLMNYYDKITADIINYENNISRLISNSKKGNALVDEMHRKAQQLKSNKQLIYDKIKIIDGIL